MFDSLNGVSIGDVLPGEPILILKTEDGGKIWLSQNEFQFFNASCLNVWRCIDFVPPDAGYGRFTYPELLMDMVLLRKTINGEKTRQPLPLSVISFC